MINSLRLLRVERGWFTWLGRTPIPAMWDRVTLSIRAFDVGDAFVAGAERWHDYVRPAAISAAVLVVLSGVHIIGPSEAGIVERFGRRLVRNEQPGLHCRFPWPVDQLTRIQATQVRTVEIGFRSAAVKPDTEPAAYEWNVQHRSGRFQSRPDESLMLGGDQNMMEVNAVVHYRLSRADEFVLRQLDGEGTVRTAAEGALTSIATTTSLDDILTTGRKRVEARVKSELQARLNRYAASVEILHVQLLDVHPSLEVVDAFREVSGAYEEKNRMINEAEAYRNEQVALSRGNAKALIAGAEGYSLDKKNRSAGDGSRFLLRESGYASSPDLTGTRLYLETMEQVLPGKRKMIVDSSQGRRHLILLEDGVEIAPPGAAVIAPPKGPFDDK